jgi:tetratricopeptide (TPR) repeat protein
LHMIQEDYAKAIPLFERITKLDPFRIRALNNLAMAYSEIPGQAAKGIDPINRAIKIAGEAPELLDTKGTVLLKAGQLDEALRTFREAVAKSDDPRFQFHVILVLLEQQKAIEAERAWKQLDLDKLNPAGLTAAERRQLEQMKKDFSKKI